MSWISDVKDGVQGLDVTPRNLRKFGLVVGFVFAVLACWMLWKDRAPQLRLILGLVGLYLVLVGVLFPRFLKTVYRVWMGFALAVGWVVSRILLIVLFVVVMTPIGLIIRLFGKRLLEIDPKVQKDSYWIPRAKKELNYEKMF